MNKCVCGERNANECEEEWGTDCDLGNNEKYVKVSQVNLPAPVAWDAPLGAIINGRTHMDWLEGYPFECEAGPLTLCTDWVELRRCFEYLADWVQALPTAAPAPVAQGEPVAWRYQDSRGHYRYVSHKPDTNWSPPDILKPIPLFTAAPAPVAQPLTHEQVKTAADHLWLSGAGLLTFEAGVRFAERAHGIKATGQENNNGKVPRV